MSVLHTDLCLPGSKIQCIIHDIMRTASDGMKRGWPLEMACILHGWVVFLRLCKYPQPFQNSGQLDLPNRMWDWLLTETTTEHICPSIGTPMKEKGPSFHLLHPELDWSLRTKTSFNGDSSNGMALHLCWHKLLATLVITTGCRCEAVCFLSKQDSDLVHNIRAY